MYMARQSCGMGAEEPGKEGLREKASTWQQGLASLVEFQRLFP